MKGRCESATLQKLREVGSGTGGGGYLQRTHHRDRQAFSSRPRPGRTGAGRAGPGFGRSAPARPSRPLMVSWPCQLDHFSPQLGPSPAANSTRLLETTCVVAWIDWFILQLDFLWCSTLPSKKIVHFLNFE